MFSETGDLTLQHKPFTQTTSSEPDHTRNLQP
jgi:hypothetical protein